MLLRCAQSMLQVYASLAMFRGYLKDPHRIREVEGFSYEAIRGTSTSGL